MPGWDDDLPEETWEYCDRCGDELTGSSHYHCAHCESEEETSMLGHYVGDRLPDGTWTQPYWHCREEDLADGNDGQPALD